MDTDFKDDGELKEKEAELRPDLHGRHGLKPSGFDPCLLVLMRGCFVVFCS
jgi:hypothetical protein